MYVGEEEGPWEQWSISPLRSSLDLDLSTSPTFPTQQDRQHRTKTAKIGSRYTVYSSHFIRAYTSLDPDIYHMLRNSSTSATQIATNSAPPSPPPSPKPSGSCSPIPRLNWVVQQFRSLPTPPASHRFPFGSRSKWMGSRPDDGCRFLVVHHPAPRSTDFAPLPRNTAKSLLIQTPTFHCLCICITVLQSPLNVENYSYMHNDDEHCKELPQFRACFLRNIYPFR